MSDAKILVTAASGQLGRLVVESLLKQIPAKQIAVGVRKPEAVAAFAARGVDVRIADYSKPDTLKAALTGIDKLLMISSNDFGDRMTQHRNVIAAAKAAGIKQIAYTSVLHADTSLLGLAESHRQTEVAIRESGIPFTILRNGWYTENTTASIPSALAHGALLGSADDGRFSTASRSDYADAAAAVLAEDDHANRVYELAGDDAFTLTEFAAEISKQSGKQVVYKNLPQADFKAILVGAKLPEPVAELLSNSDAGASKGALFDDGHQLSKLIGRPTTPFAKTIAAALKA